MKVSIIIPVFNQHEMTYQCIKSVIEHTDNCEIVVVDNGSTPSFDGWCLTEPNIYTEYDKCIRNDTNLGFPVAVNQGIRAARGDIICLLNNDTVVTPGWLDGLTDALMNYGYDIVGPMTNYVAGLQKASTAVYEDEETLNLAAEEWAEKNREVLMDVNFVIGFCMVFEKSLFEKLGDFDESMWPCSGEEIDFCFRCRELGGKVGIAKEVYIHHYGSQTFGDMQQAGILDYKKTCDDCTAHIAEKWGEDFWENQGRIEIFNDTSDEITKLNLGCGRYPLHGFINVDQFESVNPDLVCDALKLPYPPCSVDEIYCGHMLEHLTLEDGIDALLYWRALLKPGGKITITVPDFDVLAKRYLDNPTPNRLIEFNNVYIYSYCQQSHHQYCYSGDLLKQMMVKAGFIDIERLPQHHPYFVDPVDWQVAYQGRKTP